MQKVENAKKTGVLSLQEHGLEDIPKQLFELTNLSTLDLSKNKLTRLDQHQHGLAKLANLKSLNCEFNQLQRGTLTPVAHLAKLQTLSLGNNRLGHDVPMDKNNPSAQQPDCLPPLPASLKQVKLNTNHLTTVPPQICSPSLSKLQKLDLSFNHLASVPAAIGGLVSLVEINLDSNLIVALPEEIGALKKLKSLSLKNNSISVESTNFHPTRNPQPLPAALFTETPLTDLNLAGNKMTNTALNEFDGFEKFLERRQKVKTKGVYGGALTNLSVCGLD